MGKRCKLIINSQWFSNDCRQTEHKLNNKPISKRLEAWMIKAGKSLTDSSQKHSMRAVPAKNCRFVPRARVQTDRDVWERATVSLLASCFLEVLLSFKLTVYSHRTLNFVCHICTENSTSVNNAVKRLITLFTTALLQTFSQESLVPLFRFKLLKTRSQWQLEVVFNFCFWLLRKLVPDKRGMARGW